MSVKIKPLEWRQWYFDDQVTILQASFGGLYQVRIREGVVWVDWPDRPATEYATIDAAKAAAQADYEARVRRALLPDATIADLVKALEGGDGLPSEINPLSWLREAIRELERRGPADDCEDPDAYWEMVVEVRQLEDSARAALLKVRGEQ